MYSPIIQASTPVSLPPQSLQGAVRVCWGTPSMLQQFATLFQPLLSSFCRASRSAREENEGLLRSFLGMCTGLPKHQEYIRAFQSPYGYLIPKIISPSFWPTSCLPQVVSPLQSIAILNNYC